MPTLGFHARLWDVTVIGNMNATYYPHRVRLRDLTLTVLKKRGYRVRVLKHPGYKRPVPDGTYAEADYARELSQSKVVLSCSGHQRAAFLKYVEGPMAGAVFGADLPMDRPFLARTTLDLPLYATDRVILERIEAMLDDEEAWLIHATRGHELVRTYRTMDWFAAAFLQVCQRFFKERIGIWRPELEM